MSDFADVFNDHVLEISNYLEDLKNSLGDTPVSSSVRDSFVGLESSLDQYMRLDESVPSEKILQSAKNVAIWGMAISVHLSQMSGLGEQVKQVAQLIRKSSDEINQKAEADQRTFSPISKGVETKANGGDAQNTLSLKNVGKMILEQQKRISKFQDGIAASERKIIAIELSLDGLDQKVQDALAKMDDAYIAALEQLKTKRDEVDLILGHVSGRTIAGDFEASAVMEMRAADWLRYASLSCMALIVLVLGFSLWETIQQDFQWQKSLFRVILAFLLSAPAAYLARESAKHRAQQYLHLQTSLDLKAINPYLASLPEDIQHKIKAEVAAKLFGGREFSQAGTDSYPINSQELLMELIKKLEFPKAGAK